LHCRKSDDVRAEVSEQIACISTQTTFENKYFVCVRASGKTVTERSEGAVFGSERGEAYACNL
jgi:hypothetical protein